MNARIVNLRTRRKQKARDDRRKTAQDAPAPGISKLERARAEAENRRARARLEGHQIAQGEAAAEDGAAHDPSDDEA